MAGRPASRFAGPGDGGVQELVQEANNLAVIFLANSNGAPLETSLAVKGLHGRPLNVAHLSPDPLQIGKPFAKRQTGTRKRKKEKWAAGICQAIGCEECRLRHG